MCVQFLKYIHAKQYQYAYSKKKKEKTLLKKTEL